MTSIYLLCSLILFSSVSGLLSVSDIYGSNIDVVSDVTDDNTVNVSFTISVISGPFDSVNVIANSDYYRFSYSYSNRSVSNVTIYLMLLDESTNSINITVTNSFFNHLRDSYTYSRFVEVNTTGEVYLHSPFTAYYVEPITPMTNYVQVNITSVDTLSCADPMFCDINVNMEVVGNNESFSEMAIVIDGYCGNYYGNYSELHRFITLHPMVNNATSFPMQIMYITTGSYCLITARLFSQNTQIGISDDMYIICESKDDIYAFSYQQPSTYITVDTTFIFNVHVNFVGYMGFIYTLPYAYVSVCYSAHCSPVTCTANEEYMLDESGYATVILTVPGVAIIGQVVVLVSLHNPIYSTVSELEQIYHMTSDPYLVLGSRQLTYTIYNNHEVLTVHRYIYDIRKRVLGITSVGTIIPLIVVYPANVAMANYNNYHLRIAAPFWNSPMIMAHEWGHYFMTSVYATQLVTAQSHDICEYEDATTTLAEGYCNAFALIVFNDNPTPGCFYLTRDAPRCINFENYDCKLYGDGMEYKDEGRFTAGLWDLYDPFFDSNYVSGYRYEQLGRSDSYDDNEGYQISGRDLLYECLLNRPYSVETYFYYLFNRLQGDIRTKSSQSVYFNWGILY